MQIDVNEVSQEQFISSKNLNDLITVHEQLTSLSDKILNVVKSHTSNGLSFSEETAPYLIEGQKNDALLRHKAEKLYNFRRLRDKAFSEFSIFGEPAWDVILDLLIARYARKPISVSSACIAAATPPTTALRWIGVLEEKGLVERVQDPMDGRRSFIQLTEIGASRMELLLESLQI